MTNLQTRVSISPIFLAIATLILASSPSASAGWVDVSNAFFDGAADALPVVDSSGAPVSAAHLAVGAFPGLRPAEVSRLRGAELQSAFRDIDRQYFAVGSNLAGFFSGAAVGQGDGLDGETLYLVLFDTPEIADSSAWFVYAYDETWVANDPGFYINLPLSMSMIDESRIALGALGPPVDVSAFPGVNGMSTRSLVMTNTALVEDYRLESATVTPGTVDVTLGAESISIEIAYDTNIGTIPGGEVRLRPPSSLFAPVVLDLGTGNLTKVGSGGTFTLSYGMPGGSLSGTWTVDIELTNVVLPEPLVFEGAAHFEITDQYVGGAPDNPVEADAITVEGALRFQNLQADYPQWIALPIAFGYVFEIENSALVNGIANLPPGIDRDGAFQVNAPLFQSSAMEHESVDFLTTLGTGVRRFAITGSEQMPGTDAFTIRLAFDSTATLKVTPLNLPEIGIDIVRSAGEHTATIRWQGQDELDYQLYRSVDLRDWTPVGGILRGIDGQQTVTSSTLDASHSFRLELSIHPFQ